MACEEGVLSQSSFDLLDLFVGSTGELIYYIAVILISLAVVFMVLGQRATSNQSTELGAYRAAMPGILGVWLMLLAAMLFVQLTGREAVSVLPPLERFAIAVTVVMLIWAFTAGPTITAARRRMRVPVVLTLLVLAAGYVFTTIGWSQVAGSEDFNLSGYGVAWTGLIALMSFVGAALVLLALRHAADSPLKLVALLSLAAGHGWTLLQAAQGMVIGDYAGATRLALIVALLVTLVVVYRMILVMLQAAVSAVPVAVSPITVPDEPQSPGSGIVATQISPVERESVQLLRALGLILEEATAETVPQKVLTAVFDVLKVDVAGLLRLQDANYADFLLVQDDFMNRDLTPMALNLDHQPTLANAIERRSQRRLLPDEDDEEIQDLFTRLDIDHVGPAYFQPLTHDGELIAVLMIALPYTRRELYNAETEMLKGIAVIAGGLLALSFAAVQTRKMAEERAIQAMLRGLPTDAIADSEVLSARHEAEASLQAARDQVAALSGQVVSLKQELDAERSRVAMSLDELGEDASVSQQFRAVTMEQQRLLEERDSLVARLQEAEAALMGATASDGEALLQQMNEALQREKHDLEAERTRLLAELDRLRAGEASPAAAQSFIDEIGTQKHVIEADRDRLQRELDEMRTRLETVGIEAGPKGLSHLVTRLYEQNAAAQAEIARLQSEVTSLTEERSRLQDAVLLEEARVMRIKMLETEVSNLAEDREALSRQRDKLRSERDELAEKVDRIKQHRARLMAQAAAYESELKDAHTTQARLREEIQTLADTNSILTNERDRLLGAKEAAETDREQMVAMMQGDRSRLQAVGEQGVGALKSMIEALTEERSTMERELHRTRRTLADVQNQLEAMQVRVEGRLTSEATYQPQNPELLVSLMQEMRTPMTSIRGYVDLLLGESAGILGEMQRKFLQRIFTNSSRLEAMVEDLVQMTSLDMGSVKLSAAPVDVVALIEHALTEASTQFREKDLTLHINLDEKAPHVEGDRDAIEQVIKQLLSNAYLVSPPGTEIIVRAAHRVMRLSADGQAEPVESIYVAIEDRGGGIQPEDEARVFARKYRADHPLIAGLGDTGVGMSVARALVEAQGGILWMQSRENIGTTFGFALPVKSHVQPVESTLNS